MATIKVFDRLPNVGDALFLVSGVKTWVRYSESAPSGGTFVGAASHRDGHKVYILEKTYTGKTYKTENTSDGSQYTDNKYYRKDGSIARTRGCINVERCVAYWSTNGRTPTQNETIPASTNSDPVTKAAFDSSAYCKILRQTYASYNAYIGEGMSVKFPQEYGCFGLPDGKTITYALNDSAHPAFQYCAGVTYDVGGLASGDWYLPGVYECTVMFQDKVVLKVNNTMTKFGGTILNKGAGYWLAQRYNEAYAWYYSGDVLNSGNCTGNYNIRAVVMLIV